MARLAGAAQSFCLRLRRRSESEGRYHELIDRFDFAAGGKREVNEPRVVDQRPLPDGEYRPLCLLPHELKGSSIRRLIFALRRFAPGRRCVNLLVLFHAKAQGPKEIAANRASLSVAILRATHPIYYL